MNDSTLWQGLLIVAIGLFSVLGGAMDWDWFMTNRRARLFVKILGRNGARGFYILLGLGLAGMGVALSTGMLRS